MYIIYEHSYSRRQVRKGKIGWVLPGILHVILPKTLQCLSDQTLQMRRPVFLYTVVYRHANLLYKIVSIIFSSSYITFGYNF